MAQGGNEIEQCLLRSTQRADRIQEKNFQRSSPRVAYASATVRACACQLNLWACAKRTSTGGGRREPASKEPTTSAQRSTSPTGQKIPASPQISRKEAMSLSTTTVPAASASSTGSPKPSRSLVNSRSLARWYSAAIPSRDRPL